MVAAGAAMAAGGAVGRGAAADRAAWDEPGRGRALTRGEAPVDRGTATAPGAATGPRPVRGQRVRGAHGCPRARLGVGRGAGRAHRGRLPAGSGSEGNALSGARALHAARSPSTGGSCSRRSRCSTTWSCTSSATCAFRTTRAVLGARRATSPALAPAARLAARQLTRAAGVPPARVAGPSKPGQTCREKEFTEPVALLSTRPVDLPLPRTASGLSFNLLALRARCVENLWSEADPVKPRVQRIGAVCVLFGFGVRPERPEEAATRAVRRRREFPRGRERQRSAHLSTRPCQVRES